MDLSVVESVVESVRVSRRVLAMALEVVFQRYSHRT